MVIAISQRKIDFVRLADGLNREMGLSQRTLDNLAYSNFVIDDENSHISWTVKKLVC
ncbi:MAG: hypothetical protein U0796_14810 [Gemmatales bacterium]